MFTECLVQALLCACRTGPGAMELSNGCWQAMSDPSSHAEESGCGLVCFARFARTGDHLCRALRSNPELTQCFSQMVVAELTPDLKQKLHNLLKSTWVFLDPDLIGPTFYKLEEEGVMLAGKHLFLKDFRRWHIIAGLPCGLSKHFARFPTGSYCSIGTSCLCAQLN